VYYTLMAFWDHRRWHHRVHKRLNEHLYYYLASVRPFEQAEVRRSIKALVHDHHLGSVRAFQLVGPYDLLVRAWLHPTLAHDFRDVLQNTIKGCVITKEFRVMDIAHRWYWRNDKNVQLANSQLDNINDEMIKAAQLADSPDDTNAAQLLASNLIVTSEPIQEKTLRFFVAVELRSKDPKLQVAIQADLLEYINNTPAIEYASIYKVLGDFSLFLKGQVQPFEYFEIGRLSDRISAQFHVLGASTETYLISKPDSLYREERIGTATFNAIHGTDLFVQNLIPELYEDHSTDRAHVEPWLRREASRVTLEPIDKRLIRHYLVGYLKGNDDAMASAVFGWFRPIERYLRETHASFIGIYCDKVKNVKAVYKETSENLRTPALAEDGARHSLGFLLESCCVAIRTIGDERYTGIAKEWLEFVTVRNKFVHGEDSDYSRNRLAPLEVLLRYMNKIHLLLQLISEVTHKKVGEGVRE
jgi:hypothetical protein